jgi:hypothetical protein
MYWLVKNISILRHALLGLLVVAIIAPWAFDRIMVPAQYSCSAPFVRLEGDFCGLPLSGVWMLVMVITEGLRRIGLLLMGTATDADLSTLFLMTILTIAFLLPIPSTILIYRHEGKPRWQAFHMVAWAAAGVVGLLLCFANGGRLYAELWGIWLFLGLAAAALILEVVTWIWRKHLTPTLAG